MKVKFIIGAIALAMLSVAPAAMAQEDGNRDANGKIVRGPYHTNRFGDNWFVGVAGGVNLFTEGGNKPILSPALDINFGKWFTPSVGMRFGYQGLEVNSWTERGTYDDGSMRPYIQNFNKDKNMYKEQFSFAYIHNDLMWNLSNAIWGYRETRVYNLIPYVHAGYLRTYKLDAGKNEFALGSGILNTFRISNRVGITFDVRHDLTNGRMHFVRNRAGILSATVGIKVNVSKTNWIRCKGDEADKARIADLLAELAKKPQVIERTDTVTVTRVDTVKVAGDKYFPGTIYFERNHSEISAGELQHLDFYVKGVIRTNPDRVFTVTGCADKETGTSERNQVLSEERANNVADVLFKKYGVSRDRIIIKSTGDKENRFDAPELNRVVIIE